MDLRDEALMPKKGLFHKTVLTIFVFFYSCPTAFAVPSFDVLSYGTLLRRVQSVTLKGEKTKIAKTPFRVRDKF